MRVEKQDHDEIDDFDFLDDTADGNYLYVIVF